VSDPEMDLEEPIYLHLVASSEVSQEPAGVVVPWSARTCSATCGGTGVGLCARAGPTPCGWTRRTDVRRRCPATAR